MKLHIPQPCSQKWDDMTPNNHGRFCTQCDKTVIDFTDMTDAEILLHFSNISSGHACGRFRDDQLNVRLSAAGRRTSGRNRIAGSVWGMLLTISIPGTLLVSWQTVKTEQSPASLREDIKDTTSILSGRVIDTQGNPVVNATVRLRGSGKSVLSDSTGSFKIMPATRILYPMTLEVTMIGYQTRLVNVDDANLFLDIRLDNITIGDYKNESCASLQGRVGGVFIKPTLWQRIHYWISSL